MEPESVILGFACMGAIAFTIRSEDWDALFVALLLTMVWAAAYVVWWCDQLRYLPILDLLVGAYAETIRRTHPSKWITTVYAMAWCSIALDCAYDFYGPDTIVPYGHALNLAFFVQLVAVSLGGRDGIVRLLRCRRNHLRSLRSAFKQRASR